MSGKVLPVIYKPIEKYGVTNCLALALFCLWFIFFAVLWSTVVGVDTTGITTTSSNLWADWVVHLTFTNTFQDWSLREVLDSNPLFATGNFRYPPAPNAFSALLSMLGLSSIGAMQMSSFVMSIATLVALFVFFRQHVKSASWAWMGTSLFLLNGGLGFYFYWFEKASTATHLPEQGIVIQNFLVSEFIPQRAILFAAPFFIFNLVLLKRFLDSPKNINISLIAGISACSGMVLLSSMHTFLSYLLVCFFAACMTPGLWKRWCALAAVVGLFNAVIYFAYYGVNDTSGFISFAPGALITYSKLPFFQHFALNYGFVLPVAAYAIYRYRLWKNPLYFAGVGIAVVAYLFKFQPWIWDNTKIITWAYLLLLLPVLTIFQQWWPQHAGKRALVVVIFLVSITAGAIDTWQVIKPGAEQYQMFTQEDIALANSFAAQTNTDDIVLTHVGHNNWVHALAARRVFKGYSGWLWSYGLDVAELEAETSKMLNGDWLALREHGIDYIVVDVNHDKEKVNHRFIDSLPTVIQSNRYKVVKIQ